eukprot:TRINITY_DN3738_c0_g4_i2.p1 TRINITY_DN3738_c0_g4~~TRINITY_DN3738_c0_g4_i2.p1  ORF type:complete len:731 (-),score=261.28 TRINITY_DN3738_c0_g4_i2:127-2268(-)
MSEDAKEQQVEGSSGWEVEAPAPQRAVLRGLYDFTDDEVDEDVDNSIFKEVPGGLLRFDTKAECKAFMLKHCTVGSNPDYPHLQHMFTMLVSWHQIEKYLLSKIDYFNRKYPPRPAPTIDCSKNVYLQQDSGRGPEGVEGWGDFDAARVMRDVRKRLDLRFHQCITSVSTRNTLQYLYHHMRCGIYVMIRHGKLVMFIPFVNKDYTNDWGQPPRLPLKPDGTPMTQKEYYVDKAQVFRPENIIQDYGQWWANGNIICNEHQRPGEKFSQYWGDQFMSALRDLLEETCARGGVADCEFFINKRDYPHLKYSAQKQVPVEPYGFIFDRDDRDPSQDVPLKRHKYKCYTPIASFYCSDRFADIPFPPSEDWEAAVGKVYPKTFTHKYNSKTKEVEIDEPRDLFTQENFVKFKCAWEDKVDTAFFRGTATGGGVTVETNQRLKSASLSHEWKSDPRYNGSDGTAPYLDSAITGWNKRDKKIHSEPMMYLKDSDFPFAGGKENFTPIYEQSKYKYLIYIEGHCAACRYGFMMRLGSVILKAESSCVADLMWYFPLLQPMVDHVPVKADLSDLAEKIEWCRTHDEECKAIAARAGALYEKYVHKSACMDYVQALSHELNKRYRHHPAFIEPPSGPVFPMAAPPPVTSGDRNYKPKCFGDHANVRGTFCSRCQLEVDRDEADSAKRKRDAAAQERDTKDKNAKLRERSRRQAQAKRDEAK